MVQASADTNRWKGPSTVGEEILHKLTCLVPILQNVMKENKKITFFIDTGLDVIFLKELLSRENWQTAPTVHIVVRPPTLEVFLRSGDMSRET